MVEDLGLKGNELLAFSIIKAYSQGKYGCYYGGIENLARMIGATKNTTQSALRALEDKGLVERGYIYREGKQYCSFFATGEDITGSKIDPHRVKNCTDTGSKIDPNNKSNIKDININYQKEKGIKEREADFRQEVLQHSEYPTEMLEDFIRYWGEPTTGRTPRMKWELQKTWSLGGRLATWAKHEAEWKRAPQSAKQSQGFHYSAEDKERAAALREQRQREEAERLAQMNN